MNQPTALWTRHLLLLLLLGGLCFAPIGCEDPPPPTAPIDLKSIQTLMAAMKFLIEKGCATQAQKELVNKALNALVRASSDPAVPLKVRQAITAAYNELATLALTIQSLPPCE